MGKNDYEFTVRINKRTLFVLFVIVAIVFVGGFFQIMKSDFMTGDPMNSEIVIIKKASAAEIYPQFVCTCCGKPLDKDNMCCGIARDMISYIDTKVAEELSGDEVIMATVKKYGLKSLASEAKKEEVKSQLAQSAPADSPKISIDPTFHDFGDVSQAAGEVTQSFTVRNTGKTSLEINNLLSSCGCTSATLVVDGKEGPRFGMHNNPKDWSATIDPGSAAVLKVYYDPNVHPDFRGEATREITIFSNDPADFEKSIKIKLNQVE